MVELYVKTYKDKVLLLPRFEMSFARTNKILSFKLGWLLWDLRMLINF
jgi:hypothetical protein